MSRSTVSLGEEIEAGGAGYRAGADVETYLCSTPRLLGSSKADSNGSVIMKVGIPQDVEPGTHELRMVGPNSQRGIQVNIARIDVQKIASVLSASEQAGGSQAEPKGGSLPLTGIEMVVLLLSAVGLAALGFALHPERLSDHCDEAL